MTFRGAAHQERQIKGFDLQGLLNNFVLLDALGELALREPQGPEQRRRGGKKICSGPLLKTLI
jgi:hypothetical protein